MRIVCVHVPAFPLAAWYRTDPGLRGTAVAVTRGQGARARVVGCSPEAARRGISVGRSAAQSVAIHADLVLRPASIEAERAARAALCDVASSFSPRVEDAGAGTVYFDGDGLRAIHGSEAELARAVVARAARLGFDATVGIASTKMAAQLVARSEGIPAVIPPHEEWHVLAPLPIHLLSPSRALQETLTRWGIRCLGDLAALPASAVATRLGPEGAALARRARGEDEQLLVPRPVVVRVEEVVELDYGIEALDPFVFVVHALLDRLTARVALRGFVCGDLRLSLGLANRGCDERTVAVAVPSNETKMLLTLVRLHLEAHPPPAPVEVIRLAAVPEQLRPAQLDLFRPKGPPPTQLSMALARLTALCGADRIGMPVVADSHRADAYGLAPFRCPGVGVPDRCGGNGKRDEVRIGLRAIRPPQELEVFCNRGKLDFVRRADAANEMACPYHCTGRVVTTAGPWRAEGEWWCSERFSRDYYDVQLSDGVVYRFFYDRRQQEWFVDGVYD